jgi:hypothetical protein
MWAEVAWCRWEEKKDMTVDSSGRVDTESQFREPTSDWYWASRAEFGDLILGIGMASMAFQ